MTLKIEELGWTEFRHNNEKLGDRDDFSNESIVRIIRCERGRWHALGNSGPVYCDLSGRFLFEHPDPSESPVTGDFCRVGDIVPDSHNRMCAQIEEVLPRKSKLARKRPGNINETQILAANVDMALIMTSANFDLNQKRLHRFEITVREGGVQPIIVLSKTDLNSDSEKFCLELKQAFPDSIVLGLSSKSGEGIDKLEELLTAGKTAVLLGSSGVGKSTLLNSLMKKEVQDTGEIREDDSRGRHTTTSRDLFYLPSGALLIDTPGIRELQILAGQESLSDTFGRISQLISQCRFSNCKHRSEPQCAIREALASGALPADEWESYLKLERETHFERRKSNPSEAANTKKKWKTITKNMRKRRKIEDDDY